MVIHKDVMRIKVRQGKVRQGKVRQGKARGGERGRLYQGKANLVVLPIEHSQLC